jgi:tetratricopeptide (TPR) repeat protein
MKRTILTGALLAAGAVGLLAQPTTAPPQAAPAPATAPKGPSPAEIQALQAWQSALQKGDPDAIIAASDDVVTKFPDTMFKDSVLCSEAGAYQQKKDWIKAQIYAEQALAANPKSFQATLILADILSKHTGEHDLDKEEKLGKAEKYAHMTIELLNSAAKPRPDIPDQQWEDFKKSFIAQAQDELGLAATTRKNWDVAITAFKAAVQLDPQPAYKIQMANAMQQGGKNDDAIAVCDEVLGEANVNPQIVQVAKNIKAAATAAKGK